MSEPIATCRCGASYTLDAWLGLRLVGPMEDGEGGCLELRDCHCKSTLSIHGTSLDLLAKEISTLRLEVVEEARAAHDNGDEHAEARAFIAKARRDHALLTYFDLSEHWRARRGVDSRSSSSV